LLDILRTTCYVEIFPDRFVLGVFAVRRFALCLFAFRRFSDTAKRAPLRCFSQSDAVARRDFFTEGNLHRRRPFLGRPVDREGFSGLLCFRLGAFTLHSKPMIGDVSHSAILFHSDPSSVFRSIFLFVFRFSPIGATSVPPPPGREDRGRKGCRFVAFRAFPVAFPCRGFFFF